MSSISAVLATLYMPVDLPEGFIYRPDFLSESDEEQLLERIKDIEFSEFRMRDKIARRRVAHFGWLYGYDSAQIEPGPPIPEFLRGLQARAAALLEIEPNELVEALLTKYPPGAGIGWHRDAWVFGTVVRGFPALAVPLALSPRRERKNTCLNRYRAAFCLCASRRGAIQMAAHHLAHKSAALLNYISYASNISERKSPERLNRKGFIAKPKSLFAPGGRTKKIITADNK